MKHQREEMLSQAHDKSKSSTGRSHEKSKPSASRDHGRGHERSDKKVSK